MENKKTNLFTGNISIDCDEKGSIEMTGRAVLSETGRAVVNAFLQGFTQALSNKIGHKEDDQDEIDAD